MRNPPLPPLPNPGNPPARPRITHRLWTDQTYELPDAEARAAYEDEAPTRVVLTRPLRWSDELDAPTIMTGHVSSPLVSGPLGALPYAEPPSSPRRRIKRNEWALLVAAIGIVVALVGGITVFGILKLPSSSNNADQAGANVPPAVLPTPTATLAPTPTVTPLPAVESSFVNQDTATQGNWQSQYGSVGYVIVGDTQQLPPAVQVTAANQQEADWQSATSDPRALQKATDPTNPADHIAACWYSSGSFTIDVNVTDGQTYQLALYFLDWDQQNRAEIVNILDPTTYTVLDTRSVTAFANGEYLVWNVRGHVTIQITNAPGSANAVVSGVFIAPAATSTTDATPAVSPTDTSTASPISSPSATPTDTPTAIPTDTPAE